MFFYDEDTRECANDRTVCSIETGACSIKTWWPVCAIPFHNVYRILDMHARILHRHPLQSHHERMRDVVGGDCSSRTGAYARPHIRRAAAVRVNVVTNMT